MYKFVALKILYILMFPLIAFFLPVNYRIYLMWNLHIFTFVRFLAYNFKTGSFIIAHLAIIFLLLGVNTDDIQ
jgi:hypothetical protein